MAYRGEILCSDCGEIKWVMHPDGKLLRTCDDCRAPVKPSLEERVERLEKENKIINREALMMDVTEDFFVIMEDKGIKKSDLAKMLRKSESFITETLSGTRNITLRALADMAYELGVKVTVNFEINGETE